MTRWDALSRCARVAVLSARVAMLMIALLWSVVFLYFALDSLRPHSILQSAPAAWPPAPVSVRIGGFLLNVMLALPGLIIVSSACRQNWCRFRHDECNAG